MIAQTTMSTLLHRSCVNKQIETQDKPNKAQLLNDNKTGSFVYSLVRLVRQERRFLETLLSKAYVDPPALNLRLMCESIVVVATYTGN